MTEEGYPYTGEKARHPVTLWVSEADWQALAEEAATAAGMGLPRLVDVVEAILRELRRKRPELVRLFASPGQLVVYVDPQSKAEPIKLEARVKI